MKIKEILFWSFVFLAGFKTVGCTTLKNTKNGNFSGLLKELEISNFYPKEKFLSSVGVGKTPEIAKK